MTDKQRPERWQANRGGSGNTVSSGKQAVMVSVSELKENKAGKVTAGDQLVLTGLATEGVVFGVLTGRGPWAGRCSWGPPRQPRGLFPFCKSYDVKARLVICLASQHFSHHV